MSLSTLPLGYCTNAHPGQSVADVLAGIDKYTVPVQNAVGHPIAAGLWLAKPVVDQLLGEPEGVAKFAAAIEARGLTCYTLNAFPYGDFHAARVKENVYLPDWSQPERLAYTEECAAVLAAVLPDGTEGSISTLPLKFKGFQEHTNFFDACHRNLVDCARWLDRLKRDTGRVIRLAIEPEPFCLLETTQDAVEFFQALWKGAAGRFEPIVREHIGLCYDVCHQAVEFEHIGESVRTLDADGIRINKVQISCAIQLDQPASNRDAVEALRRYVEPRYLHQAFAITKDGQRTAAMDLTESLIDSPAFAAADCWRIHFHVPVDAEALGPLRTTRPAIAEALAAVAQLNYAPHLEVETYTWEVLPGIKHDLVTGLTRELQATEDLILKAR